MREIFFRGKSIINGEWHYGYYIRRFDDCIIHSGILPNDYEIVKPETIGQYKGLTDKNGKKIFEGDIVRTKYGRICKIVQVSLNTYCGWNLIPIGEYDCKAPDKWDLWNCNNLVVIGNVWDNLELMRGNTHG